MKPSEIIAKAEEFVKTRMTQAEAGHDWWHILRVWNLSKTIAETEQCNDLVLELGAIFHDIADTKFHGGSEDDGGKICANFLSSIKVSQHIIDQVVYIINHVSFRKGLSGSVKITPELAIVMDADRLDAIGAIGIARTFNFGGHKNRPFYDPAHPPKLNMSTEEYKQCNSPTINHFYEKLLLLKDKMNTKTGKEIAVKRHLFMEQYLEQFYGEWNGNR